MERFIFEVIEPLLSRELNEQQHQERTTKITQQLKAFIRGEMVPINKELAKKTRELFVATADIEKLKEDIERIEKDCSRLRQEVAGRENDIFKQKMAYQREIQALGEEVGTLKKDLKNAIKKGEMELQRQVDEHRDKIFDLKREHKIELEGKLAEERAHWEAELAALKETHAQEKSHLIQEGSKERSKLIKKYEERLYNQKSDTDALLQKTTKELNEKYEALRKSRSELEARYMVEQETTRRLTLQLEKQASSHRSFRMQFQSTFKELESNRARNAEQRQKLQSDYDDLRARWKETEKVLNDRIRALSSQLSSTIQAKDKLFNDTVERMNTEHRLQVDSINSRMLEEREIVISNMEVRAYEDMFQQIKKYQALSQAHRDLQEVYGSLRETYQGRLARAQAEHEAELSALQQRGEYEKELSGESARKEYSNLEAKYQLELRSLRAQAQAQQEALVKRSQEQKAALSNKLISQYQSMLADQRSSTQIQLKQKLLQFDRKAKAFQKRIAEGEKRKGELKVSIERMKLQSQMKIQSMMEANQKLQLQIQALHERILQMQKVKSAAINDYQFQLLMLRNEVDKIKEEYHLKEDELRADLNQRIHNKNREIARFAERVKQDTEELIRRNLERVNALEKEYEELKRVINQKTSLPEDIDALRTFHAAYIEKETELNEERKRREELQRELQSKDAIEKVFVGKDAFKRLIAIEKLANPNPNLILTSTSGRPSFPRGSRAD